VASQTVGFVVRVGRKEVELREESITYVYFPEGVVGGKGDGQMAETE